MLIAFTADWHLRGKDLAAAEAQLKALFHECRPRGVQALLIAGDIFDKSNICDNSTSTGAVEKVAIARVMPFAEADIVVIMIPGNHDMAGEGSEDALHCFDKRPGISVVRKPEIHIIQDTAIHCLHWSWANDQPLPIIQNLLDSIPPAHRGPVRVSPANILTKYKILLAHIQVIGAAMNDTAACKDKPGKWQISPADLQGLPFDRFALGDFHRRQDLTDGRGGYVGALRQCNFGEEGNPAGFEIHDTETGETEWVELDAAPRYKTITIAEGDPLPDPDDFDINFKYKIRVQGLVDHAAVKTLEAVGAIVENIIPRTERLTRAEVPDNAIQDPRSLIPLWAKNQTPPLSEERIARLTVLFDKKNADREEAAS